MRSRTRYRTVIFFLTFALILTIHLRISSARLFHQYRLAKVEQDRLVQQLWQKQLEWEGLVHPNDVSDQIQSEIHP